MSIKNELKEFVGTLKMVTLTRTFPNTIEEHGFVLGVSDNLVLLHQFRDFREEGYVVFRVSDVSSLRSSKYERKWEQMFKQEGLLDHLGVPFDVPVRDTRSVVEALQRRGDHILFDCEDYPHTYETGFHMGLILSTDRDHFEIHEYDATGKWYSVPFEIRYASVTHIEFESPYARIFAKYVDERPLA